VKLLLGNLQLGGSVKLTLIVPVPPVDMPEPVMPQLTKIVASPTTPKRVEIQNTIMGRLRQVRSKRCIMYPQIRGSALKNEERRVGSVLGKPYGAGKELSIHLLVQASHMRDPLFYEPLDRKYLAALFGFVVLVQAHYAISP
jgi:hypothetical protein